MVLRLFDSCDLSLTGIENYSERREGACMNKSILTIAGAVLLSVSSAVAYSGDNPALSKQAKITHAEAEKTALAKEPGTVTERELEKEHGKLIYSFDIKTANGIHEVNVDAVSGKIVEDSVESPSAEAKEKAQDKQPH